MDEQKALIAKNLSDEVRIKLVEMIAREKKLACKNIREKFDLTQPTLSHHLCKLVDSGLINKDKVGTQNFYSLNKETLNNYVKYLNSL